MIFLKQIYTITHSHIHTHTQSRKGDRIRDGIRASFRENANETDPDQILVYKQRAVAALQNYLVYDSACNDPKLRTAMEDFSSRESER